MSRSVNGLNSNSILGIIAALQNNRTLTVNIDNATISGTDDDTTDLNEVNTTLDDHETRITTNTTNISDITGGDLTELSLTNSAFHAKLNLRGSAGDYSGQLSFMNWNTTNQDYDIKSMMYHSTSDYLAFSSSTGFKFINGNVGIKTDVDSNYSLAVNGDINLIEGSIYIDGVEFETSSLLTSINTNTINLTNLQDDFDDLPTFFEIYATVENNITVNDGIKNTIEFNKFKFTGNIFFPSLSDGILGISSDEVVNYTLTTSDLPMITNDKITSMEYSKLTSALWEETGVGNNTTNNSHNICQVNSLICTSSTVA